MKNNKNIKISKKGFIADAIPNFIALVVIFFIIISFHFIFAAIEKNNDKTISFDNEPMMTAESVLYSFLEADIEHKGIECFGDNKDKTYNYSVKDIIYSECNCNGKKLLVQNDFKDAYANDDNRNMDIQIKSYYFDYGNQEYTTESPLFSDPKRGCDGKPSFDSNAYVFLPVKGGLLKVEATVKEYSDKESCLR